MPAWQRATYNWVLKTQTLRMDPTVVRPGAKNRGGHNTIEAVTNKSMELRKARAR